MAGSGFGDRVQPTHRVFETVWWIILLNKKRKTAYSVMPVDTYFTHDNGGRPFRVEIRDEKEVALFQRDQVASRDTDENIYESDPSRVWSNVAKVWVGKSPITPMTSYSGGHGPRFDGNSLLLELTSGDCVFVGEAVKQFRPQAPIVKYVSEVGNNDVPYPLAVDQDGRRYLMTENVILTQIPPDTEDSYRWYYDRCSMTPELSVIREGEEKLSSTETERPIWTRTDVLRFFVGPETYNLTYTPYPRENFAFLIQCGQEESEQGQLYVVTQHTYPDRTELDEAAYVSLMEDFARKMGFEPLQFNTLIPRRVW